MCRLPQMIRSFQACVVYAPYPGPRDERINAEQTSQVLYRHFLEQSTYATFIRYCRDHYVDNYGSVRRRCGGQTVDKGADTMAVGVRFAWDLLDLFVGQYATMFFPTEAAMRSGTPRRGYPRRASSPASCSILWAYPSLVSCARGSSASRSLGLSAQVPLPDGSMQRATSRCLCRRCLWTGLVQSSISQIAWSSSCPIVRTKAGVRPCAII